MSESTKNPTGPTQDDAGPAAAELSEEGLEEVRGGIREGGCVQPFPLPFPKNEFCLPPVTDPTFVS